MPCEECLLPSKEIGMEGWLAWRQEAVTPVRVPRPSRWDKERYVYDWTMDRWLINWSTIAQLIN